ncbi:hypothetical protein LINPERPRIM_LOCUS21491 [Linum perenne]
MDSGFKEDLRSPMGTKEMKVPQVFVKRRMIGEAANVEKLDEERMFYGIQRRLTVFVEMQIQLKRCV